MDRCLVRPTRSSLLSCFDRSGCRLLGAEPSPPHFHLIACEAARPNLDGGSADSATGRERVQLTGEQGRCARRGNAEERDDAENRVCRAPARSAHRDVCSASSCSVSIVSRFLLLSVLCMLFSLRLFSHARAASMSAAAAAKMSKPVVFPAKQKHTATMFFLHGLGDSADGGWSDVVPQSVQRHHTRRSALRIFPADRLTLL